MTTKSQVRIINGQYVLVPNSKSGGMANVYSATDILNDQRRVAVKIFKHEHLEEDILTEAFKRETEALKELKHERIVELFDAGIDEETGQYFLVLEWLDNNLDEFLKASPPEGWDTFAEEVAIPLLEALAFAHSRYLIHRDIKPSNILIDANGTIKLADFGISKLKKYTSLGRTLAEFTSPPYSPPETDDGTYTYTRDVFGFGVLVLDCLTDIDLVEFDDIDRALEELDAPPQVIETIEKAVSRDPVNRQTDAIELLDELESIHRKRVESWVVKRPCYLELTRKAQIALQQELDIKSQDQIEKILAEDLNAACGISLDNNPSADGRFRGPYYYIYGISFIYHVAVKEHGRNQLVIIVAWRRDSSQLENFRDYAWHPPYEFKFGLPPNITEAEEVIRELQLAVDTHEANQRATRAEKEEMRVLNTWKDMLSVKADVEKERKAPIKYKSVTFQKNSNRVIFHLSESIEEDLIGQPRQVKLPDGGFVTGEVDEVYEDRLVLYVDFLDLTEVPLFGELIFDTRAADNAINRQRVALDDVLLKRAKRADLRDLLVRPKESSIPQVGEEIQFIQPELDDAKKDAVRAALGTADFLVVEGPPGTGKTMFITELVLQTIRRNPESRILLSSQTHVALDNVLEQIHKKYRELKLVRIGHIGDKRISPEVEPLLVENQMERWNNKVIANGQKYIKEWAAKRRLPQKDIELAITLKRLSLLLKDIEDREKKIAALQAELDKTTEPENRAERHEDIKNLKQNLRVDRRKTRSIQESLAKTGKDEAELSEFPWNELDSWVADLIGDNPAAKMFQKMLGIHSEWLERFGRGKEFHAAFLVQSQVIAGTCVGIAGIRGFEDVEFDLCIIDEASKATATEVLIPLSRSRRWVLVGDSRQLPPFQDEALQRKEILEKYELDAEQMKVTLFDRLLELLPQECHKILTVQYRMVEPIGNLISESFYDGNLTSPRNQRDADLERIFSKPVVWLTTAGLSNRQEFSVGSSYVNPCETQIIRQLLNRLNFIAELAGRNYNVAVLAGYLAQRTRLEQTLSSDRKNWRAIKVECNTVDAFQGREADVAVYSVTRSNAEGKIGFLRDRKRLNVALSRGRDRLVIVGNHQFCRQQMNESPLRQVLDYIETHPKDCALEEAELTEEIG